VSQLYRSYLPGEAENTAVTWSGTLLQPASASADRATASANPPRTLGNLVVRVEVLKVTRFGRPKSASQRNIRQK
jgi:hypothetical protein